MLEAVIASATIEVIAEPTRRHILDELLDGEQPVSTLVARLSMAQPAVSKHLRILREAGLVTVRADGQRRLYRLRPDPLVELDQWLEPYRQMWRSSLEKLETQLSEPPNPSRRK
jgi:DNA-binding transcriptional ArsR family regulator